MTTPKKKKLKVAGGEIPLKDAEYKHLKYKNNLSTQTDFVVFDSKDLAKWLENLTTYAAYVKVCFALEGSAIDIVFMPCDGNGKTSRKTKISDPTGYNIGNRHPIT